MSETKTQKDGFSFGNQSFLQAVVIVRFTINVCFVEGLVRVQTVRGSFDRWVLKHPFRPLRQLGCVVKAAEDERQNLIIYHTCLCFHGNVK